MKVRNKIMAKVTVSVNGKPVGQYIGDEKSREIQQFLQQELRGFGRYSRGHIITKTPIRTTSRPAVPKAV
jgi:hypothetical protein